MASKPAPRPPATPTPVHCAWKFCPRCGNPRTGVRKNPFRCKTCGFSHFFAPVAAVGAVATDPSGQVLLLIRANDPGKGLYGLPGGFVDAGESCEEALVREVYEEVQLQVTRMEYLTSFPNQYTYQGFILPVTDVFFTMEVATFDSMTVSDGEISSWLFCRPGRRELKQMAFESNRKALEVFLRRQ